MYVVGKSSTFSKSISTCYDGAGIKDIITLVTI